ncbi:MAG: hypothetical protein OCD02_12145 [Spirochaetaceae bacterium]
MIDLDLKEVIEVVGSGMIVKLTNSDEGILLNFESEEGGRVIRIQPHESDPKTLVLSLDRKKPTFEVVK